MPTKDNETTEPWVSVRHLQHIVAHAAAAGITRDELLAAAGLTDADLAYGDGHVPISAIESMLALAARRQVIPLIGLELARNIKLVTLGPLGHLVQVCATFNDVLEAVSRYRGLLSNIGQARVVHRPGAVEIGWTCLAGGPAFRRQATEYVLGVLVVLARFLMPEQADLLLSVHFAHGRPAQLRDNHAYFRFFRAPVYFDSDRSAIVMPVGVLNMRMPNGDTQLKALLETHAARLLAEDEQSSSLPEQVGDLVMAMKGDFWPQRDAVAMQLGMSGRSLARKLRQHASSYRQILDDVRLGEADRGIRQDGLSVTEMAGELGFSSHQAFLRWFRQTTGTTPTRYREMTNADRT